MGVSRPADPQGEAANPNEDVEKKGPLHHIATDKNSVSSARGGQWTPRFKKLFDRAGVKLSDKANKVRVPGHFGPHPEAYHQIVFDRLSEEVGTKTAGRRPNRHCGLSSKSWPRNCERRVRLSMT